MGRQIGLIVVAVVLVMALAVGCASWESVPPGHVGVVSLFGEVERSRMLAEGAHWINPFADVTLVDCRISAYTGTYACASKDMQDVTIEIALNAHPDAKEAGWLFQNVGVATVTDRMTEQGPVMPLPQWYVRIVRPAAQEVAKASIAKYSASEVLAHRQAIKDEIQKNLVSWCARYKILIPEVSLADVDFDQQYNAAIRAKQVKEQEALRKEYELQEATKQAEIAKKEAEGKANGAIEAARGQAETIRAMATAEAEAMLVKAEAQAKGNRLVAESLTGAGGAALLSIRRLEKWDGVLPRIVTGNGADFLMGVTADAVK